MRAGLFRTRIGRLPDTNDKLIPIQLKQLNYLLSWIFTKFLANVIMLQIGDKEDVKVKAFLICGKTYMLLYICYKANLSYTEMKHINC